MISTDETISPNNFLGLDLTSKGVDDLRRRFDELFKDTALLCSVGTLVKNFPNGNFTTDDVIGSIAEGIEITIDVLSKDMEIRTSPVGFPAQIQDIAKLIRERGKLHHPQHYAAAKELSASLGAVN